MNDTTKDEAAKAAALSLLTRGLVTVAEASRLAGVSRQVMKYWARDISIKKCRNAHLSKLWRTAIKRKR